MVRENQRPAKARSPPANSSDGLAKKILRLSLSSINRRHTGADPGQDAN
jgi:hypothetical protein